MMISNAGGVDLRQLVGRQEVTQVIAADFGPIGFEPADFVIDELLGDAAAIGEGGHAGDGGGELAACK